MSDKILQLSWKTAFKEYALVTLGVVSYALGWTIFLLPNNLIGGGVSGCIYPVLCDRASYGGYLFHPQYHIAFDRY